MQGAGETMQESSGMQIHLNGYVWSSDEQKVGELRRVVIDPDGRELKHLVVSTGTLLGRDVLIECGDLERTSADGTRLYLRLNRSRIEALPEYRATDPAMPSVDQVSRGARRTAATTGASPPEAVSAGAFLVELAHGGPVVGTEGARAGDVEALTIDPGSGYITAVGVNHGGLLSTLFGTDETAEIPGEAIRRIDAEGVHLQDAAASD